MRTTLLSASLVTLLSGCSGGSPAGAPEAGEPAETGAHREAAARESGTSKDAGRADAADATSPSKDAARDAKAAPDSPSSFDAAGAGSGPCASCTAMMCPTELEACAASSECTNGIVAFNSCFTAPSLGASCGATFAMQGSAASAIWACMAAMCKSTCL